MEAGADAGARLVHDVERLELCNKLWQLIMAEVHGERLLPNVHLRLRIQMPHTMPRSAGARARATNIRLCPAVAIYSQSSARFAPHNTQEFPT